MGCQANYSQAQKKTGMGRGWQPSESDFISAVVKNQQSTQLLGLPVLVTYVFIPCMFVPVPQEGWATWNTPHSEQQSEKLITYETMFLTTLFELLVSPFIPPLWLTLLHPATWDAHILKCSEIMCVQVYVCDHTLITNPTLWWYNKWDLKTFVHAVQTQGWSGEEADWTDRAVSPSFYLRNTNHRLVIA